jgi:L-ascorbate metabolism protein UlaG (beta-lactamase superfamily)
VPTYLTFIGHSTVLFELDGVRLLTDPVLRGRVAFLRRYAEPPAAEMVERIDAVLLSHLHIDHFDVPSLRRVGTGVRMVVPRGAGAFLRRAGFTEVEELSPGEIVQVGPVEIAAVLAEHRARRWPIGGPVAQPMGFDIRAATRLYFAGDTDLYHGMGDFAGRFDVALLPVWGWGITLGPGHLDPRRAAQAAALVRPRLAVPIHWGALLPIGRLRGHAHLLRDPPRQFAAHVAELAPGVEARVLEPGECMSLPA